VTTQVGGARAGLDPQEASRALREVVALSTLPSLWSEPAPRAIAMSLAGALLSALRCERVAVTFHDPEGQSVTHSEPAHPLAMRAVPNASRISLPVGIEGEKGAIDVWTTTPLRAMDELVLNVAANQAAVWLDHARLAQRDREANARMRDLLESIEDAFFAVDAKWQFTYLNPRAHQTIGELVGPRESFVGARLWDVFAPAESAPFYEAYQSAMRERRVHRVEGHYAPADRWFEATVYPTNVGLGIISRDITARKRDEARLHALSQLSAEAGLANSLGEAYDAAFRAIESSMNARRASILLFDADGVMRFDAARGLSPEYRRAVEGHTPWKPTDRDAEPILVPDATLDPGLAKYGDLFERERIRTLVFFPLHHEGRVIGKFMAYHENANAFGPDEMRAGRAIANVLAIAISRRRAEEDADRARHALAKSDKLSALGMLVSGVAHELRTPLTIIDNNAFLLDKRVPQLTDGAARRAEVERLLRELHAGVDRANDLVSRLKRYTKLDSNRRTLVDLSKACEEAVQLIEATRRSPTRVAVHAPAGARILADAAQVQQVLLNLVANALDATGGDAALVRVSTRAREGSVELVVEDDGVGMTEETRARLFQPLFTTKPDGTGLGLSIVKRIVDDHKATIACESSLGKGTRFIVTFPAAPRE
jgi:PAS domain S-box-containing protein